MENKEINSSFLRNFKKTIIYTIGMFFFSIYGIGIITAVIFDGVSGDWFIINLCIGIIFTIFLCTFTIIDEIKKNTK